MPLLRLLFAALSLPLVVGAAELHFAFSDALRVWDRPAPLSVPFAITRPDGTGELWLKLTVSDWQGTPVQENVLPVAGDAAVVPLQPLASGWYGLHASLGSGQTVLAEAATSIAQLPPLPPRFADLDPLDCRFGVCVHLGRDYYNRPETIPLLELAGLHWIRDDLSWGAVEREAVGRYTIPEPVWSRSAALRRAGIRSLLILGYGNPFHAHGSPEEPTAFEPYAEYVARELAGVVDHFEIWNEPNGFGKLTPQLYPAILKAGYRGVKRGNPEAFVVGVGGSSPGGWGGHYIHGGIYPQSAVGFMDSFSIHPYVSPWAPETGYACPGAPAPLACLSTANALTFGLAERIAKEKDLAAPVGIWITEQGWPVGETVTLPAQAQAVCRAFLFMAANPQLYARCFLYDFVCDGTNPADKEHNFGLLNHDLSPRPSYVAAAVATRMVEGLPSLGRVDCANEEVQLQLFGTAKAPVLAAWVTEVGFQAKIKDPTLGMAGSALDKSVPVVLTASGRQVTVTDWQGRSRQVPVVDGQVTLQLGTWPQYVSGFGSRSGIAVVRPE